MSTDAPWLALSVDWMDSEMFDEATDAERLAWIALLCHAKKNGRAGRARIRKSALAREYRLSIRGIEGMLSKAQKCAAIELDGDTVFVVNWRRYQQKAYSTKSREDSQKDFLPNSTATHHQAHITHHTSPSTHHQSISHETEATESTPNQAAADAAPPGGGDGLFSGEQPASSGRKRQPYPPEFEAAWEAYQRRGTKGAALKRYRQAFRDIKARGKTNAETQDFLIERIRAWVGVWEETGKERQFWPYLEKWLRDAQFDSDEQAERAASPQAQEQGEDRARRERVHALMREGQ